MGRGNIFEQSSFGHQDIPESESPEISYNKFPTMHYLFERPANNANSILCVRKGDKSIVPGEIYHITIIREDVTCQKCLELLHA